MNDSVWKDVPGYDGRYSVSNKGEVKRLEHIDRFGKLLSERTLLQSVINDGHRQVTFDGRKRFLVHYLVLLAFVGDRPTPKTQIRHLDSDPGNNELSNLRYGTARENALDAHALRVEKERRTGQPRYSIERAFAIAACLKELPEVTHRDIAAIAKRFEVSNKTVWRIAHNKAWGGKLAA